MSGDPIGTAGPRKSAGDTGDIAIAMQGGSKFMDRLQQLAALVDQEQEAFRQLGLGNDVVAAMNDAKGKQSEAAKIRQSAVDVYAKARADAEQTAADAKAESDKRIAEAQREADRLTALGAKIKSDADSYAADTRSAADAKMTETTAKLAEARNAASEIDRARADAAAAAEASKRAQAEAASQVASAEAMRAAVKAKHDKVSALAGQIIAATRDVT